MRLRGHAYLFDDTHQIPKGGRRAGGRCCRNGELPPQCGVVLSGGHRLVRLLQVLEHTPAAVTQTGPIAGLNFCHSA